MKAICKIVFRASVIFILLILIVPVIWHLQPIQFTNPDNKDVFEELLFFGLPIAILFTLSGTIKRQDTVVAIFGKVALTIFVALVPLVLLFATALDGMCQWTTDKVLFEKTGDTSTKIVLRDFGCGATDSTSPIVSVFKITYYTPYFMWVRPIDTTKINKTEWKRIEGEDYQSAE